MQNIILKVNGTEHSLLAFQGTQQLSGVNTFYVDTLFDNTDIAAWQTLLQQQAIIEINANTQTQTFVGIVTAFREVGATLNPLQSIVRLQISSSLYKLTLASAPTLYLGKNVQQITQQLFAAHGMGHTNIDWQVRHELSSKPYRLQAPDETDLQFLQRLLSREGIYYFSDVTDGEEVICFRDHSLSATAVSPATYAVIEKAHQDISLDGQMQAYIRTMQSEVSVGSQQSCFSDLDINKQDLPLSAKSGTASTENFIMQNNYFAYGTRTIHDAKYLASVQQQALTAQQQKHTGASTIASLKPGFNININNDVHNPKQSDAYFLTEVQHQFSQLNLFHDDGLDYYTNAEFSESHPIALGQFKQHELYNNHFCAIKATTPYRDAVKPFPRLYPCMTARVESQDEFPALDENGNIFVRPHFARTNANATEAMPALPRLQPNLNAAQNNATSAGTHLPLYPGTEVLLSAEFADPDRLFVLSSVPTNEAISPVTAINHSQNVVRTQGGHHLIMDDNEKAPYLELQTDGAQNILHMHAQDSAHQIRLETVLGHMQVQAANDFNVTSQQNIIETNQDIRSHSIDENASVKTQHGDIHYQAANNIVQNAVQDILYSSENSTELKSADSVFIDSQQDIQLCAQLGDLHCYSDNGKIMLHADEHINISAMGNGDIHINNDGVGFKIDNGGNVHLYGNNVALNASNNLQLKGKVQYLPNAMAEAFPAMPGLPPAPDLIKLASKWNAEHQQVIDILELQFELAKGYDITLLNGLKLTLNSIQHSFWMGDTIFTQQKTLDNGSLYVEEIDFDKPWLLSLGPLPNKHIPHICAINDKPYPANKNYYCAPGQLPIKTEVKGNYKFRSITLKLKLTPQQINFNFRAYSLSHLKKLIKQQVYDTTKLTSAKLLTVAELEQVKLGIKYFNDSPKDNDIYNRSTFTDAEIAHIKANGNNATIFIHGFNVPYGEHSYDFNLISDLSPIFGAAVKKNATQELQDLANKPYIVGHSDNICTLYRDPKNKIFVEYQNPDDYKAEDVNGKGAHSWWTNMSNNLNEATDKFDYQDYTKYTNVIGIAWQGDPSPINFMADVYTAKMASYLIAPLIERLHKEGITINVIAHSMGNCVLLNTLNRLGSMNLTDAVDHAFMWEPSVPNFALSNKQHPSDPDGTWFFPHATAAAKKITVLYSNNDNVLGPIPPHQLNQNEINKQKPVYEIIIAVLFTSIGLESIYEMAVWAGFPVSAMFESKNLEYLYQHWIRQHPKDKDGNTFAPTLEQQTELYKNDNLEFLKEMETKLATAKDATIKALKNAGKLKTTFEILHALDLDTTYMYPFNLIRFFFESLFSIKDFNTDLLCFKIAQKWVTIFDVMYNKSRYNPVEALGYGGYDPKGQDKFVQKLHSQGKLIPVDQTKWLWSHSGMMLPSENLMKHVYKKHIIGGDGIQHFGAY